MLLKTIRESETPTPLLRKVHSAILGVVRSHTLIDDLREGGEVQLVLDGDREPLCEFGVEIDVNIRPK